MGKSNFRVTVLLILLGLSSLYVFYFVFVTFQSWNGEVFDISSEERKGEIDNPIDDPQYPEKNFSKPVTKTEQGYILAENQKMIEVCVIVGISDVRSERFREMGWEILGNRIHYSFMHFYGTSEKPPSDGRNGFRMIKEKKGDGYKFFDGMKYFIESFGSCDFIIWTKDDVTINFSLLNYILRKSHPYSYLGWLTEGKKSKDKVYKELSGRDVYFPYMNLPFYIMGSSFAECVYKEIISNYGTSKWLKLNSPHYMGVGLAGQACEQEPIDISYTYFGELGPHRNHPVGKHVDPLGFLIVKAAFEKGKTEKHIWDEI